MADTVEFHDVTVVRASGKALLCNIEGEDIWMPKSQITDDSEVFDDDEHSKGTLIVTRWIAEQKNLV